MKSALIVLFRTYSYQFVNVHTHFHTGEYKLTRKEDGGISHVVHFNGTSDEMYTVTVMDKKMGWEREIKKGPNLTAVDILFEWLRPCTIYTVSVKGCNSTGDQTFTSSSKCFTLAVNTLSNSKFRWDIYCTLTSKTIWAIKSHVNSSGLIILLKNLGLIIL